MCAKELADSTPSTGLIFIFQQMPTKYILCVGSVGIRDRGGVISEGATRDVPIRINQ